MRHPLLALVLCPALLVGCTAAPEPDSEPMDAAASEAMEPAAGELPPTIVAARGGFAPEGVEFDTTRRRLLTGSLSEGSIFEFHPDGQITAVVTDPDLVSSVGIEVDELRERLLVANADRSVFQSGGVGTAALGIYNLGTGDRIAMVDLAATVTDRPEGAGHFANDVTVTSDGTAYVTDTRMGVIYRVGTDHAASVFHRFGQGVSPNGLVAHPDGYLLVGAGATLWRVPLDNPAAAAMVTLPEEIPGQDGLVWTADGLLAIVSNSGNRVVALASDDGWTTASLAGVARYETQATTAAVVGDDLYVVHPHMNDQDPPSVERVTFE
ncbi:MAG: hypothetical protein FJW23_12570 [Acidimicrobiia bacterium]|nr:hypothetical protein [Acidimicrobiia bacterium]